MTTVGPGWRWRITGRGFAALAIGGVLLAAGRAWRYPGLAGLGSGLLAVLLLEALTVLRRTRLTVRRTVRPRLVPRLAPCVATVQLRRLGGLAPASLDTAERIGSLSQAVAVPRLAPRGSLEVTYAIPTERRGVLAIGPLTVRRRGVAGLAESSLVVGAVDEVRVLPRVLPVAGLPTGVTRGQVGADERLERGGTDLIGLREYVPGDDLRRLHWATSARTRTLMVREDADPSQPRITVLLDDRAGSYPEGDIEDAVEVAASLAVAAIDGDHGLRLVTASGNVDLTVAESSFGEAAAALAVLAEVAAGPSGPLAESIPSSALDVAVVVTGALAERPPLLAWAGRAALGVLAVVDPTAARSAVSTDPVTVLSGRTSVEVLRLWDQALVT